MTEAEELELLELEKEAAQQKQQIPSGSVGRAAFKAVLDQLPIVPPALKWASESKSPWDFLSKPEQTSKEGLGLMADAIPSAKPTGNILRDVALNTPKIAVETLRDVAPSFINRSALVTSGLLKGAQIAGPAIKTMGRGLAGQLESASGISPQATGSLEAAYKDPTLIMSQGKKAAGPLYEAAKNTMQEGESIFSGMYKPDKIIDTANEYLQNGGKLEPTEALTARQAVDKALKSNRFLKGPLYELRDTLDEIVKKSEDLAKADPIYSRGIKAEALRNVLPQNKYGGASPFKAMLLKLTGGLAAPLLSPALQGAAFTGAGIVGRNVVSPLVNNPSVGTVIPSILKRINKKTDETQ